MNIENQETITSIILAVTALLQGVREYIQLMRDKQQKRKKKR
jgi:hypothetical protein